VVAGLDRSTDNGSLLGAAFGYMHNNLSMPADTAKATGPSYYGAVYGRLVDGRNWFDGEVFYMHTGWSVERGIPGIGVATARPNTDSEGFLLQASTEIGDTGLRPYGRFTYALSHRGGVLEGGVGPLGFDVASQRQSAAVGEVGVLYAPVFTTSGGMTLRPSVRVGVQDNAGDHSQTVDASVFGISGTAFSQAAPRLWGVAGVVDGSLKVRINQSVELFGDVTGRFGDHQTDAAASVGGVIRF
jgi:outer membrane autotransporter protein